MKTVFLMLTAAIAIAGEVARKGTIVEVTDGEGRDLLHRGKARLATAEEVESVGYDIASSGTDEAPLHPDIEAHQADRADQAAEAAQDAADAAAAEAASDADAASANAAAAVQGVQGGKSAGKRGK